MCNECSNNETENDENINMDELREAINNELTYVEPFLLNTDNLAEDIGYDLENFTRGISDGSYLAGYYTALINAGMSNIDAINTLQLKMSSDMNIKLTEDSNKATIEASKNQSLLLEKQQL